MQPPRAGAPAIQWVADARQRVPRHQLRAKAGKVELGPHRADAVEFGLLIVSPGDSVLAAGQNLTWRPVRFLKLLETAL
jgi:hypothetical protein